MAEAPYGMEERMRLVPVVFLLCLAPLSCQVERSYVPIGPDTLPESSLENPPEQPFDGSSYLIALENLRSFYEQPGEFGYVLDGLEYGFEQLSMVLTETQPGAGPPLHLHPTEEAHVLLSGSVDYLIGDRLFQARAPYVLRVPAGIPHTYANAGPTPLNLISVLPASRRSATRLGPNPLLKLQ